MALDAVCVADVPRPDASLDLKPYFRRARSSAVLFSPAFCLTSITRAHARARALFLARHISISGITTAPSDIPIVTFVFPLTPRHFVFRQVSRRYRPASAHCSTTTMAHDVLTIPTALSALRPVPQEQPATTLVPIVDESAQLSAPSAPSTALDPAPAPVPVPPLAPELVPLPSPLSNLVQHMPVALVPQDAEDESVPEASVRNEW